MSIIAGYELSYSGEAAEEHQLDFYDVAQALIGFERSLALTTHFAINGKIIYPSSVSPGGEDSGNSPSSWKLDNRCCHRHGRYYCICSRYCTSGHPSR